MNIFNKSLLIISVLLTAGCGSLYAAQQGHNNSRGSAAPVSHQQIHNSSPDVHQHINNNSSNWQSHNRQSFQGQQGQSQHQQHNDHDRASSVMYYLFSYPVSPDTVYDGAYTDTDDSYSSSSDVSTGDTNDTWVSAQNGIVPDNAIVSGSDNNNTTYRCRAVFQNQTYYGELVPNDACYVKTDTATIRFDSYDVQIQP